MVEENILSISLKDYKKQIDDLKGSLLNLQKGSSEYEKVLQEVRDKQNKLNEVLSDTKTAGNAAANSMAEMRESIKQMKAEAEKLDVSSNKFKELSSQILETTNKLKTLEQSQGDFSKNIGNYAGGVIDAFNKMGVSVSSLQGAFNIATQAGVGFNTILTTLKAHPIVAALTILLGIVLKVKDAIGNSEQASRGWAKAMSAFQPIMDVFNRILEKCALILVDVADWIGKNLPNAFNFCGKVINGFVKVLGGMAKTAVNIAGSMVRVYTKAFEYIGQGVAGLANTVADAVEGIPGVGETVANGLKNAANNIKKFTGSADAAVKNLVSSASSGIDSLVNKVTGAVSNTTSRYEAAAGRRRKIVEDQFKLEDNIRKQQEASAQSELKQAELRDKIMTSTGKERLELIKQLRAEVEANGKREVEIAREQLRIQKTIASFAPNTKADNERIAELQANVVKAEANYTRSFAKIDKMYVSTEKSMSAASAKESAAREKQAKEEAAARAKAAREAIEQTKLMLETSDLAYSSSIKYEIEQYKKLNDEHSKDTDAMTQHLENAKNMRIQQINEQIQAYETLLTNVNLSDNQQIDITNKITALTQQKTDDIKKYNEDLKKVALERLEIMAAERQAALDSEERVQHLGKSYAELYANLSKDEVKIAVAQLNVDEDTKAKILEDYALLYEDIKHGTTKLNESLEEERHNNNVIELQNRQEHLDQLKEQQLISNEDALQMQIELNRDLEDEDLRHAQAQERIRKENEKRSKEHAKKIASIYQTMSGTISNLLGAVAKSMEDDIKTKQENGEITEEEAKKQFETVKALQVVQATIDTISGAIQAYTTAQSLGPIAGPIVGGINAAAVTAMGMMNISKIKQQQWKSTSGTGEAAVPSARSTTSVDFSGVSVNPLLDETADINRMTTISEQPASEQRVYILQSDIEESQQQVQIRQTNTTF